MFQYQTLLQPQTKITKPNKNIINTKYNINYNINYNNHNHNYNYKAISHNLIPTFSPFHGFTPFLFFSVVGAIVTRLNHEGGEGTLKGKGCKTLD